MSLLQFTDIKTRYCFRVVPIDTNRRPHKAELKLSVTDVARSTLEDVPIMQ